MLVKAIFNKKCKQTSKSPGCDGSGISAYPQICSYDPDVLMKLIVRFEKNKLNFTIY